jgi:hypothetical protein
MRFKIVLVGQLFVLMGLGKRIRVDVHLIDEWEE